MAYSPKLTEEKLNSLDNQILEVFRIPMCLTEPISANFIADVVEMYSTDEEWLILEDSVRNKLILKRLEKLEAEKRLTSQMVQVKSRNFTDDIHPPKLNKRVRVYNRG